MHMNDVQFEFGQPITGYGPGFFRVGDVVHDGPCLVCPNGVYPWQGYHDHSIIRKAFRAVDLILVGTGAMMTTPESNFTDALARMDILYEFMSTPPACRTYNVLLGERRNVGAVLLPV